MFSLKERVFLVKEVTKNIKNIEVVSFKGLTADFAKMNNINFLIRGLRNFIDFENEKLLFRMNQHLFVKLESIFLISSKQYSSISSSLIKEIVLNRGDVSFFLPKIVQKALNKKFF